MNYKEGLFWSALNEKGNVHHLTDGIHLYKDSGILATIFYDENMFKGKMQNCIEIMVGVFEPDRIHFTRLLSEITNAADRIDAKLMIYPHYVWIHKGNAVAYEIMEVVRWLRTFGFKGYSEIMFRIPNKTKSF